MIIAYAYWWYYKKYRSTIEKLKGEEQAKEEEKKKDNKNKNKNKKKTTKE